MNKESLKYRYPGAQPFSIEQQKIFFGRTKDIENLYNLISLEQLIVLYSKSGLGKSSLVNAGLIPKMLSHKEIIPFSIRFGAFVEGQNKTPCETTIQQITLNDNSDNYLEKLIPNDNSLWHHIKKKQLELTNSKQEFLLIFDQFEELFTYNKSDITKFKQQIQEVLSKQIPQRFRDALEKQFLKDKFLLSEAELEALHRELKVKVLFVIRSDRMSLLNELKDYLPNILRYCYELSALSVEQAEDAILLPAYKKNNNFLSHSFDIEDTALDTILRFLTKDFTQKIESFQLQILCQNIEKKVIQGNLVKVSIVDIGNVESVYHNHYNSLIEEIEIPEEQLAAKRLIEEGLIFEEEERRISLYEGQIYKSFGVSKKLLNKLLDSHLLRAEPSMQGGYTYELCHDTLVSPVLEAKKNRIEEEERERKKQELERKRKIEEEKRKRTEEKKLLELAQKKRKVARNFSFVLIILFIISVSLATFAFFQREISLKNEEESIRQEKLARANAAEAEKQRIIAELKTQEALDSAKAAQEQRAIAIVTMKELEEKLEEIQKLQKKNREYEELLKQLRPSRYQRIDH